MEASAQELSRRDLVEDPIVAGAINPVEVGAALFQLGYEMDSAGRRDAADAVYRQTIELLESLSDRKKPAMRMSDLAALAFDHGQKLFSLGRYQSALAALKRSLEILDSLILLDASYPLIERLGVTLNWVARVQRKTGRIEESCQTYERAAGVWRSLLQLPQSKRRNEYFTHNLATALLGRAKALHASGKKKAARTAFMEFAKLLKLNVSKDSVNWS